MRRLWATGLSAIGLAMAAWSFGQAASAESIKIGVVISQTGPGASLGIPQAKTVPLLPKEIAGQSVDYIVLDDGSDATKAVANARKLITDDKVDALVGGSITPASIALVEVAAETKTPFISLAGSSSVVAPMDEKKKWAFKSPQNDVLMATAIADHMATHGVKSAGFIGFSDAYGDGWLNVITPLLEAKGHQARRGREICARRHQRHRADPEDPRREARRGADRGRRHAGGPSREDAARARLHGRRLSDAWRGQQ